MPAPTFETITVEVSEEVALLTLNRPDRANTISPTLTREVREAFANIESDAVVRAVIVTGAGRHFCGGADLRELGGGGHAGGLDLDFSTSSRPPEAGDCGHQRCRDGQRLRDRALLRHSRDGRPHTDRHARD